MGAPLDGCDNTGPKSVIAARGFDTALVRLAVLRCCAHSKSAKPVFFGISNSEFHAAVVVRSRSGQLGFRARKA